MFKRLGLSSLAVMLTTAIVLAGGAYSNFPIIGIPADTDCQSYGNNNVCNQYRPAGPTSLTGNEIVPSDTQLPGGQNPQTVDIPVYLIGSAALKNAIVGGDFSTNLWQRGTTFTALTPTTAAYSADRWFTYSSGNTVTITKQTGASDISLTDGMTASMRVSRPSGTDVTPICVGQVIPAKDAERFLGRNAVFSFYAMAPTTFSPTNDAIDVTIAYVTATDSATPNTITDSFAKATTTGYTAVVTKANAGAAGTTVASGAANMGLTQTFVRYYASGTIPTTATSVGVKICFTPAASTGASTDWFEFGNAQLEAAPATVAASGSNPGYIGGLVPSGFGRRQLALETSLQQSFSYGLAEQTTVVYPGGVLCSATANALIAIGFPTQLRIIPTVTVTAGGWSIQTAVAVTAIGTTTLTFASTQAATLTSAAACTSTLPYQLKGTNTTGLFMFSAEP